MVGDSVSRRSFLQNVGLVTGGIAAWSSTTGHGQTSTSWSKKRLVQVLSGVHNFLTTPFFSDFRLDAEGLRRNVAFHARSTPENMTIVVSGGLGEIFSLSVDEHKRLVEAAVAGAEGKIPVVAGVGGGYRNALLMARNAEQAGATAIFIYANPLACDQAAGALQYVSEVAKSVRIGAMAYPCAKGDFWPDVLRTLIQLPNVMGFKDPSGELNVGAPLVSDEFLWVAEGEGHAEKTLPAGGQAYTTAVATFVPRASLEFWRQGTVGDVKTMRTIREQRIDPIVKLRNVQSGYGISGIKVALEALGRAGGPVRPPGTQVAEQDRIKIATIAREHAEKIEG